MTVERKDDGSMAAGVWVAIAILLAFIAGNRLRDLGFEITIQQAPEHNQNQELK